MAAATFAARPSTATHVGQRARRYRTGGATDRSPPSFAVMRALTLITLLPVLAACASSAPVAKPPASPDPSARQPTLEVRTVHATSNPILSDGTDYTTDPAPLVAGEAASDWTRYRERRSTISRCPSGRCWRPPPTRWPAVAHYPHFLKPDEVLGGRLPVAPMPRRSCRGRTANSILRAGRARRRDDQGQVRDWRAVADTPLGPWVDAHPEGPVVSCRIRSRTTSRTSTRRCSSMTTGASSPLGTFEFERGRARAGHGDVWRESCRCENAKWLRAAGLQAQRHLPPGVAANTRPTRAYGGVIRVHRVRNGAVTAGSVDLSRGDPRSGLVDHVAPGDRVL